MTSSPPPRRSRARRIAFDIALFVVAVAIAFLVGVRVGASPGSPVVALLAPLVGQPSEHPLGATWRGIDEVWGILRQEYVNQSGLAPERLREGTLRGMVEAVGDPYTAYVDPAQLRREQTAYQGHFEGIGAEVTVRDKRLTVVAPIHGGPAERAGIKAGDWIVRINDQTTANLSLTDAVDRIRGPRGTVVKLTIQRADQEPLILELTREELPLTTVSYDMLPDGVAHVRITRFSQRTGEEVVATLHRLQADGATAIVLDLRNNLGGILDAAVDTASQFLPDGIVLYQEDAAGYRQPYPVKRGGLATDMPLAVLVNGATASGSEVLAGALQDAGRAPLIGTKTFGKGAVLHLRQLSDGGAIYVTFARWLTPSGRQIEGHGLAPDIASEQTRADFDSQRDPPLERAIAYLKNRS